MKHLENLETKLDTLLANPEARLEFWVGEAPVIDIHCDKSVGAPRFVVRMLKSLSPRSGPTIIETSDRASVVDYLKRGFTGVFLGGSFRNAIARLVDIPTAA
jgi:hypothetical protein